MFVIGKLDYDSPEYVYNVFGYPNLPANVINCALEHSWFNRHMHQSDEYNEILAIMPPDWFRADSALPPPRCEYIVLGVTTIHSTPSERSHGVLNRRDEMFLLNYVLRQTLVQPMTG
jgi:hypothetical protein